MTGPAAPTPGSVRLVVVAIAVSLVGLLAFGPATAARATPHTPPTPGAAPRARPSMTPEPHPTVQPSPRPSARPSSRTRPTPRPSPSRQPSPRPATPQPDEHDDPGTGSWFSPARWLTEYFRWLARSILNRTLRHVFGDWLLATPDVTAQGRVHDLWKVSAAVANTVLVLGVIAAGVLLGTHGSLQARYGAKDMLARIVWAAVSANCSLLMCGLAIQVANAMSRALMAPGVDADRMADAWTGVALDSGGGLVVLLAFVAALMLLAVVVTFVARLVLMVLVVVAAPLCLMCHVLPGLDKVALIWWRSFVALLATQVGQALTLIASVRIFFISDGRQGAALPGGGHVVDLPGGSQLVNLILVIGLAFILIRIPNWARKVAFRVTGGTAAQIVKLIVVQQLVRGGVSRLPLFNRGRGVQ